VPLEAAGDGGPRQMIAPAVLVPSGLEPREQNPAYVLLSPPPALRATLTAP